MSTKMNIRIYTSLDHRSIIPYVQCEDMFPLLILEDSSEELGRDYKLGIIASVFFWSLESILV
jgi:hypothetical protein